MAPVAERSRPVCYGKMMPPKRWLCCGSGILMMLMVIAMHHLDSYILTQEKERGNNYQSATFVFVEMLTEVLLRVVVAYDGVVF